MKKGVSPLLASILLIGLFIILAGFFFKWIVGFFGEVPKEKSCDEEAIDICEANVEFVIDEVLIDDGVRIKISNKGDRKIESFSIIMKEKEKQSSNSYIINKSESGRSGLEPWETDVFFLNDGNISGYEFMRIVPSIVHNKENVVCAKTCGTKIQSYTFND